MRLHTVLFPFLCLGLMVYFAYHMKSGDRGLEAQTELAARVKVLEHQHEQYVAVRETWEHKVDLLRPEHLDPDMLSERVRAELDFADPDDVVVVLPKDGD